MDENLGRIRTELERLGIADNTIILYTSDHGSHFRTRNHEYKRSCHDGSIKIPMIAYGPGFMGGKVIDDLVSLMDVPVTFLHSAGIERPEGFRGNPLTELVAGNDNDWPEEVFYQISESQVGRGIRTKKWKYAVSAPDKKGFYHADSDTYIEEFLYDLEADPYEKNNLVADMTFVDIRHQLSEVLVKRMVEVGEVAPQIMPVTVN